MFRSRIPAAVAGILGSAALLTTGPASATPDAASVYSRTQQSNAPIEYVRGRGFGHGFHGGFRGHGFHHRGFVGRGFYGRPRYGYGYGYRRRGIGGAAVLGGLAAGALVGSAIAANAAAAPDGNAVAYCEQRFKSYDPASGTYLGYDGERHACP